jgi:phosphopantothenoylcysteine decarboxylase/phosphopantothenate--cysteine ligase
MPPHALAGRTVALCITGSIAAYKAATCARLLVKAGATVLPVMTKGATRFVAPVTFAGICGQPVAMDMFDATFAGEMHVSIADRADVVLIAPATADTLARLAQGRADDLVAALALSARGPVLAAPAMHPRMWGHPATVRNVEELARQGRVQLLGPVHGEVASGDVGHGRMMEPEQIVLAVESTLAKRDLAGVRVVVTAGPTLEDIDPVRFFGNRSSGKMGFAIAARAARRGAVVRLIAGPVSLPTPWGTERTDVRSALEMRDAVWGALRPDLSGADLLIMAAAVADYRPQGKSSSKLKRQSEHFLVDLVQNPDILAEIGAARAAQARSRPTLVGFALETGDATSGVVAYARGKLTSKKVDMVVANEASDVLGLDDTCATFVTTEWEDGLPRMPKEDLADALLDRILLSFG